MCGCPKKGTFLKRNGIRCSAQEVATLDRVCRSQQAILNHSFGQPRLKDREGIACSQPNAILCPVPFQSCQPLNRVQCTAIACKTQHAKAGCCELRIEGGLVQWNKQRVSLFVRPVSSFF